jgi:hypothetical protein
MTAGRLMDTLVSIQNVGIEPFTGNLTVRYELPPEIPPVKPAVDSSNASLSCQTVGQAYECTGDATGIQPGSQIRLRAIP